MSENDALVPVILVVDDNADHRFLAGRTITQAGGYRVDSASSGQEALEKLRENSYDLILLDYNMPGMNGGQVLSQILEQRPDASVVMLTGGGSESLAVELIKAGASDYIVKSDDYLDALPTVVKRAFDRKQLTEKTQELERERVKLTKLSAVVETAITVNHEINNPLFAIKANAQLLQRHLASDSPKSLRQIQGILESCERISEVTRKLANLVEPTSRSYAAGSSMIDLSAVSAAPAKEPEPPIAPDSAEAESASIGNHLPALWQATKGLSSSLDLEQVFEELAIAVARMLPGCGSLIGLMEEDGGTLSIHAGCRLGQDGELIHYQGSKIRYRTNEHELLRQVMSTGEPALVQSMDDPRLTEDEKAYLVSQGASSIVIAPMIYEEKTIGALALKRADRAITHRETALCQLLAGQASFAVYNALQHRDLKQRTEQMQALVSGLSAVNSTLDLHERLQTLAQLVADQMGTPIAAIRLLEGENLTLGAATMRETSYRAADAIPAQQGLGGEVLRSDGPLVIEDLLADPRPSVQNAVNSGELSAQSYIGIRLAAQGKTIGVLGAFAYEKRHFTPEQVQTFASLAEQAAIAIDTARLHYESLTKASELVEKRDQIEVKNDVVRAILATHRIEDVCDLLVRNAPRLIPCDIAVLTMTDPDGGSHRVVACWSDEPTQISIGRDFLFDGAFVTRDPQNPEPRLISDLREITNTRPLMQEIAREGFLSSMLVPISISGRLLGTITLAAARVEGFQQEQSPIAMELADQAAIAMQNAMLLETISVSKAEWEATFDAITDPVWVQTPECFIVKVNRAAAEVAGGMPPRDLIGLRCCQAFHGSSLSCDECPVRLALVTGEPSVREYEGSRDAVYLASAYPVFGEGRRLVATVCYVKEVTEQRRVYGQLIQSGKLAAIGELAAGVAHNFNNLLTGVRGAIELLQMQAEREEFSPKVTARLQSIKDRLDQGDGIVGRLLSFARGSSEQPEEVTVGSVVRDALAVCETHSDRKGLNLRLDLPENLPNVLANESQLQQVLVNLVINAFQATERGGTISVEGSHLAAQNLVELRVRDTGCGIAEEDLSRIFEPFYTKRRGEKQGTGLGLSVSRTMIEAMGGTLRVESTPGEGTLFTIALPIYEPEDQALSAGGQA